MIDSAAKRSYTLLCLICSFGSIAYGMELSKPQEAPQLSEHPKLSEPSEQPTVLEAIQAQTPKEISSQIPFLYRFFFNAQSPLPIIPRDVGHLIAQKMPTKLFYPIVTTTPQVKLEGHNKSIWSLTYSNDSNYMVTTSETEICLWDLKTHALLKKFSCEAGRVRMGMYDSASKTIAVASRIGVQLCKLGSAGEITIRNVLAGDFTKVRYTETGRILAASTSGSEVQRVYMYDPVTNECRMINLASIDESSLPVGFNDISFSHNAKWLIATDSENENVILLDLDARKIAKISDEQVGRSIRGLAHINNNGTKIVVLENLTGMPHVFSADSDGFSEGSLQKNHKKLSTMQDSNFIQFDPVGHVVLAGRSDRTARVWEATTEKVVEIFSPHGNGSSRHNIFAGSFNPNGGDLAFSCENALYIFSSHNYTTLASFLQKQITLKQLLFLAFFEIINKVAKNRENVFEFLKITTSDANELEAVFRSFNELGVRKYLKNKYRLDWQA